MTYVICIAKMSYLVCKAEITNIKNDICNMYSKNSNSKNGTFNMYREKNIKNDICNMYSKNYKQQK